jgi:hypothetical protein
MIDDKGKTSIYATDSMADEEAEATRERIEKEHAEAGTTNRWIRVGGHSIQSRQIQTISVDEPPSSYILQLGDDD